MRTTQPSVKELREFGIVTGALFALVFGLLLPWLFELALPTWPWIVLAILVTWGIVAPATLRLVYVAWMKLAVGLSKVTTPIVMGLVFYLVIVPAGIIFRMVADDPLKRAREADLDSYRVQSQQPKTANLEKPY